MWSRVPLYIRIYRRYLGLGQVGVKKTGRKMVLVPFSLYNVALKRFLSYIQGPVQSILPTFLLCHTAIAPMIH